jgi:hypothetical protein
MQQRAAFSRALATGHLVLQSAASATANESAGRAPLYLSALSRPLVATGFAVRSPAEAAVIDPGAGQRPPWPAEPCRSSGLDPAAAPLLGRGPEVEALGEVLDRVAAGQKAGAVRARVVEDDGPRLRFRHDLIRAALYEDLPDGVRLGLHREAGQRLAAAGPPAVQVAEQLARAATPGDAEAGRWLSQAAREATATSPDVAAGLLARAVGLMDAADPGRDVLLAEQAGSLLRAGRRAEAEATCRALLGRDHDPSVTAKARICLGRTLLAGGRARDALRELRRQPPRLTCTTPSRPSTDHQRPRRGAIMPTTGRTSYGAPERARGGRAVPVRLQVTAV